MHDAGVFLRNYLEFVEDFPNEIQSKITRFRENDCITKNLITEVEKISLAAPTDKSTIKMHQILVQITELKDEKIQLSQSLTSQIENKYKIVVDSYNESNVIKQERSPTPKISITVNQTNSTVKSQQNISNQSTGGAILPTPDNHQEKATKRIRKTRIDNLDVDSGDDVSVPSVKSTDKSQQSTNNKRSSTTNANKKQKKRKTSKKQSIQIAQEVFDEVIQDDGITDETTYCICQQISYGEMIFCENDTCPIEWFHFSCVDLTAKPKGRWFCPQCRGDKPNVINKNLRKKQQESSI